MPIGDCESCHGRICVKHMEWYGLGWWCTRCVRRAKGQDTAKAAS